MHPSPITPTYNHSTGFRRPVSQSGPASRDQKGKPLCLIGDLAKDYVPFLPEALRRDIALPKGTPLDGALTLARRFRSAFRAG